MQTQMNYRDAVLLAVRLITAAIFLNAGYLKLPFWSGTPEGMTGAMAGLVKFLSIVEPLGGLAVLIGFLTRWAAAGLAIELEHGTTSSRHAMIYASARPGRAGLCPALRTQALPSWRRAPAGVCCWPWLRGPSAGR